MNGDDGGLPTMWLYGALIAFASGGTSLVLSTTGPTMGATAWAMLLVGLAVVAHGVVLLLPLARPMAPWHGPLMVLWGLAMLTIQGWMARMTAPMDPGATPGVDVGMVALAVLMLASGLVMARAGDVETMGFHMGVDDE